MQMLATLSNKAGHLDSSDNHVWVWHNREDRHCDKRCKRWIRLLEVYKKF